MLISRIKELFNLDLSLEDFKKEIEREVSEYKKSLDKKGSSSAIFVNADIKSLLIKKEDIKLLCDAFLSDKLDKWELNYICEAILLSENIILEKKKVKDALLALTDSEYFKLINREFVKDVSEEVLY
jgi:hypothetical protein